MKDSNSLAYNTWNCKYHIVFEPKYRRMEICTIGVEDIMWIR